MADKGYAEMTAEELEQQLRESFFYPDVIDDTVFRELEAIREALEKKKPIRYTRSARESWERFAEDHRAELEKLEASKPAKSPPASPGEAAAEQAADERGGPKAPISAESAGSTERCAPELPRRRPAPASAERTRGLSRFVSPALRRVLIAAALIALLTGAALAAGPRLWVWVRSWNDALAQDTPAGGAAAGPIQSALEALEITEPVYPGWMPSNYVLTEAHVSKDPLFLYELYTREDHFISISVAPISAVETEGLPRKGQPPEEYQVGETVHYIFSNSGSITAVWYTEHYFVSVSGSVTIRAMKRIIDSVYGISEWR